MSVALSRALPAWGRPTSATSAAKVAFNQGVLALGHHTSTENVIKLILDGSIRPRSQVAGKPFSLGGSGDVSYFVATGKKEPSPKSYSTGKIDVYTLWSTALFDRADWFWNPGLDGGYKHPKAVTPGNLDGLEQRSKDIASNTGHHGEVCFTKPVSTRNCFRIFVETEAQRREILDAIEGAPPPYGGSWAKVIRVGFPKNVTLTAAEAPKPF